MFLEIFNRIVIGFVIIVSLLLWYLITHPNRYRKRSYRRNDLKVKTFKNREVFRRALYSKGDGLPNWADLANVSMEYTKKGKRRVVGGFAIMTKPLLVRNKKLISNKVVARDAKLRKEAKVPGRKAVAKDVVTVGKTTYSLWHITHGLPFRYCLSDGQVEGLMFMGTAHLNSGSRYDIGYVAVNDGRLDSVKERVADLKAMVDQGYTVLDCPIVPNVDKRYPLTQYSMDDVERLADYVINSRKDDVFKYGFECLYKGNQVIPHAVVLYMVNVSQRRPVFKITLENRK